ncbi:MAG: UvrD-helicase domain-containing protein [Lachnospiraceae bacterium]|nr:UvrD-helicase domain-containing protein [Lachnospiraceae bacterium]
MTVKWTKEQQQVIDARGQNILVSAAAGSGKTAVLVERIIKRITDETSPVDIDRLLVVTFTNAAAAEMRGRIRDALEERAERDPDNIRLQKQLVLVHNAKITTIHSFCLHVLRNHFQTIGIDPAFRIADEGEVTLLEREAVKEVVSEAYECTAEGSRNTEESRGGSEAAGVACQPYDSREFTEFLEQLATGKEDGRIEEMILQIYHFALGQPFPEEWLQECRGAYETDWSAGEQGRPVWFAFIEADTAARLADIRGQLEAAIRITQEPDGPYPYEKALLSDLELVDGLERGGSFEGYLEAFRKPGSFARLGSKKDENISEEKKQQVQAMRADCKDQIQALRDRYYYDDMETLRQSYEKSGVSVRVLTKLTEAFMKRLSEKKAERNILDFGDMEHLALNALVRREVREYAAPGQADAASALSDASSALSDSADAASVSSDIASVSPGSAKRMPDGADVVLVPTAVAQEYAETFEEVLTDEYQDSNLVQELILNSVSGKGIGAHNRFMVGDVKQSIYRFRLARPELFLEKYHRYRLYEPSAAGEEQMAETGADEMRTGTETGAAEARTGTGTGATETEARAAEMGAAGTRTGAEQEPGCRIDLHRNFRSRPQVLEAVNSVFRRIMTEPLGGVVYDDDAALYAGAEFPEAPLLPDGSRAETPELLLLDGGAAEGDSPAENLRREEARMVGSRIRRMVGVMPVLDKESGGFRPARYGDIVILLRSVSGWAETFGEVLTDMGIPCFTGSQKGYFSAAEVRVVLSYLQILDNPQQDIPLAAVLRSAIGRLNDEELAEIRLAGEADAGLSFYDCCQRYRERVPDTKTARKLEDFFAVYETLREKCAYTPVHQLLWELLEVTGYGEYAAALPAGKQRRANLDMLVEKAVAYEATSFRGLYHFVRYIENLQKYEIDYGEANIASEADDTVRIMSIHKSKGLEFPIVFVSGMGKQFNETDVRSSVVLHPEWGIACDCVTRPSLSGEDALRGEDELPRMRQSTLLKKVIQQKLTTENLGEELRILYVAMTRAKEKLILTGSVKNLEKRLPAWKNAAVLAKGGALGYSWLSGASAYLDWVVPALMDAPDEDNLLFTDFRGSLPETPRNLTGTNLVEAPCDPTGTTSPIKASHDSTETASPVEAPCDHEAKFRIFLLSPSDNDGEEIRERTEELLSLRDLLQMDPDVCRDEQARDYLERVFETEYPYEANQAIPGKVTVSELKKMSQRMEENDAQELYAEETVVPLIPHFMMCADRNADGSENTPSAPQLSGAAEKVEARLQKMHTQAGGAARGTGYHTFMENLIFSEKEELRFQLEELISCGKMSGEEAAMIHLSDISAFLRSQIGQRMERAAREGKLFREQPFVLGVPADEIYGRLSSDGESEEASAPGRRPDGKPLLSQETILVQGIIDAWFLEDGQITVVDYKTDRVADGSVLVKRYRTQIDYYQKALERLTGQTVSDRVIYSFCLRREIHL